MGSRGSRRSRGGPDPKVKREPVEEDEVTIIATLEGPRAAETTSANPVSPNRQHSLESLIPVVAPSNARQIASNKSSNPAGKCPNCGGDHRLHRCSGPTDLSGRIPGCGKCKILDHTLAFCPKYLTQDDVGYFVFESRSNKPPVYWDEHLRHPDLRKYLDEYKPWTAEFAQRKGAPNPNWRKIETIPDDPDPTWEAAEIHDKFEIPEQIHTHISGRGRRHGSNTSTSHSSHDFDINARPRETSQEERSHNGRRIMELLQSGYEEQADGLAKGQDSVTRPRIPGLISSGSRPQEGRREGYPQHAETTLQQSFGKRRRAELRLNNPNLVPRSRSRCDTDDSLNPEDEHVPPAVDGYVANDRAALRNN
ncbi:hypothetical protein G7Y89_g3877 [Cudoniella acicularis]|uniref:Uncharacterized protein n=1 Tax=Cudoniella acicularis TaxID=354080 RepID=A0A8H4RQI7_9HELO|nr:hypothetical protein G7Y89_g3877 [Cudoniella acicularis]